ncbi:MAG: hypothetical protein FWF52_03830 [Candidatus Azobacteroides sp.]|nr:hypothetical protein [Candidatus Azobacteroides sp.]
MYKYILKRKIKKYVTHDFREKSYLNLKDIHSILVLFDTAAYGEADTFVEKLKKLGKQVTVYAYQNKKDKTHYSKTSYNIITGKEVESLFKNPMEKIAKELAEKKFDAVIDLNIQSILPMEYLLVRSQAPIKTGLRKADRPPLHDFSVINLPDKGEEGLNVRELAKQIIYYLHMIRSKS